MPLSNENIRKIMLLELQKTLTKLQDDNIVISFDESALDKIATESFDPEFGARNTQRYIEKNIESLIAKFILEDKIKKGESRVVTLDATGNFVIQ